MRKVAINISNELHMLIHYLFALAIISLSNFLGFTNISFLNSLLFAFLSFLPDLEHLVFLFTYGNASDYSKKSIKLFKQGKLKELIEFFKSNHKNNTSLFLHNIGTPIVLLFFSVIFFQNSILSMALVIIASHYIYDIIEDLLIMGRVNENWRFKFNRNPQVAK